MDEDTNGIIAVCTVIFDLDKGQTVEYLYPPESLTEDEAQRVAFHALPDTTSRKQLAPSSVRDMSFFFRVPRQRLDKGKDDLSPSCSAPQSVYGYVLCRQRRDDALPRGAEQRSVAVLSSRPFHTLWSSLCRLTGAVCLVYGQAALRDVYEAALSFPAPLGPPLSPDVHVRIRDRSVALPRIDPATVPGNDNSGTMSLDPDTGLPGSLLVDGRTLTHGPYSQLDVPLVLRSALPQLWQLWELVVLGEPLVVVGATPGAAADAVAGLLDLATPLPYAGDVRPYLTVQDPVFGLLVADVQVSSARSSSSSSIKEDEGEKKDYTATDSTGQPALPTVIGVTNLYFLKALPDWPNIVAVGWDDEVGPESINLESPSTADGSTSLVRRFARSVGDWKARRAGPTATLLSQRPRDGCWLRSPGLQARTQHSVLSALAATGRGPSGSSEGRSKNRQIAASLLRRHFQELTRALLFPLLPAVTPPQPKGHLQREVQRNTLRFDPEAILQELQKPSGTLPDPLLQVFGSRAAVVSFYAKFLRSSNCHAWVAQRQADVRAWLEQKGSKR